MDTPKLHVALRVLIASLLHTWHRPRWMLLAAAFLSAAGFLGVVVALSPIVNRLSDIFYDVFFTHSSSVVAWINHSAQTVVAQDAPLKPYLQYILALGAWIDLHGGGILAVVTAALALATFRLVKTTETLHTKDEERRARAEEAARREADRRASEARAAEEKAREVVLLFDHRGDPRVWGPPQRRPSPRPGDRRP